jgi:hypothetical protein
MSNKEAGKASQSKIDSSIAKRIGAALSTTSNNHLHVPATQIILARCL